jgi:hypothetical protein
MVWNPRDFTWKLTRPSSNGSMTIFSSLPWVSAAILSINLLRGVFSLLSDWINCCSPGLLSSSRKIRLEFLKRLSNEQGDYLKRLYDRRPISERYLSGEFDLHIHFAGNGMWCQGPIPSRSDQQQPVRVSRNRLAGCENQDIRNKPKALKRFLFSVPQFCSRIGA